MKIPEISNVTWLEAATLTAKAVGICYTVLAFGTHKAVFYTDKTNQLREWAPWLHMDQAFMLLNMLKMSVKYDDQNRCIVSCPHPREIGILEEEDDFLIYAISKLAYKYSYLYKE